MKTRIVFFFAICIGTTSFADCASSGFYFWPQQSALLSENPVIIIEGYGMSQRAIMKLTEKHPVYLKSQHHKVQLDLLERHVGGFMLTQALFRTTEPLHAGEEYDLYVANYTDEYGKMVRFDQEKRIYVPVKWKVETNNDEVAPTFIKQPKLTASTIQHFGCGPAKYMNFDFEINETSACLVKVTLVDKQEQTVITYYLNAGGTDLNIGHGMCSGQFELRKGATYKIVWELMDLNLNRGKPVETSVAYQPKDPFQIK